MDRLPSTTTFVPRTLPAYKCPKSLRFCGKKVRPNGQTLVELALILLPFFAILFALVDYAQLYFYENSLQNALRETARFTTEGRIIQTTNTDGSLAYVTNNGVVMPKAIAPATGDPGGTEASRNECSRYWFNSNCVIHIPTSNIVITSAPCIAGVPPTVSTNSVGKLTLLLTNGGTANKGPGAANDYVQVSATYTIKTITPLIGFVGGYTRQGWNTYPVYVSAIVKNEPAALNFLHTSIYTNE
jgi:Flp pilus assembly protein TadG